MSEEVDMTERRERMLSTLNELETVITNALDIKRSF